MVFGITGTRYEEDKVHLILFVLPFNCKNGSLQFRLKGLTTKKHSLTLMCIKVFINFCSINSMQSVNDEKFNAEKAFSLEKILKCSCYLQT